MHFFAALALTPACQNSKKAVPHKTFFAADAGAIAASNGIISNAVRNSKVIPTGYKGAEGKVANMDGALVTTVRIEGNDPGFFVEFPEAIEVGIATQLVLSIRGNISQREGWDHYGSIQLIDGNGRRYIVRELCGEGTFGNCAEQPATNSDDLQQGITLVIELPPGIRSIGRFEVVFVGLSSVAPGFTISDIGLH